mmetsp:Transcript_75758/g.190510  ORF Transcript_75758/g.190510 Transcript_75758/m.190510 type:complete len:238 (+) Transcript_75758:407-1120(+)
MADTRALPPGLFHAPIQKVLAVQGAVCLPVVDEEVRRSSLLVLAIDLRPPETRQRHNSEQQRGGSDGLDACALRQDPLLVRPLVPALRQRARQDVLAQWRAHEGDRPALLDLGQVARAAALPSAFGLAPEQEELLIARPISLPAVHQEGLQSPLGVGRVHGLAREAAEGHGPERRCDRSDSTDSTACPHHPAGAIPLVPFLEQGRRQDVVVRRRADIANAFARTDLCKVRGAAALPP